MKKLVSPWTYYKNSEKEFNKYFQGENLLYRKLIDNSEKPWIIYYNDKMQIFTTDVIWINNDKYNFDIPTFYSLEYIKAEIDYNAMKKDYFLLENNDLMNLL